MAKTSGRLCLIKKNAVTIAGGRTVSMTVNGSPVNVEDQGDAGFATYLSGILTGQSIEMSIEGYEDDQVLRDLSLGTTAGRFLSDITFEFPNGDVISGDFVLSAYSETGALEDGQTFNGTFTSNGAWTYTEAA